MIYDYVELANTKRVGCRIFEIFLEILDHIYNN